MKNLLWNTLSHLTNPFAQFAHIPFITFSHLRWDFVVQRPQHIMTRLSKSHPLLFVEEPIRTTTKTNNGYIIRNPHPNITVLVPTFSDEASYENTVSSFITQWKGTTSYEPVLWFYSPNFVAFSEIIDHSLVVYDCMDEFSLFRGADPNLLYREKLLVAQADIIFTGGLSLYEAKKSLHKDVYCFPSSVDRAHFARAVDPKTMIPPDMATLPHPTIGYCGVVDERIDLELLSELARRMRDAHFVMIGPVVKIDPATLPKLPNIHYLGQKHYSELPSYIKGLDIAMMPFAKNESTRFISPTKTPEYLAAQKPVISTPIKDVIATYRDTVKIASSVVQWQKYIEEFLTETSVQKNIRIQKQLAIIGKSSWDKTVHHMWDIINDKLHHNAHAQVKELEHPFSIPRSLEYNL